MGKVHERIDKRLREFLERQHVFFVATAPTDPGGYVNVSPKGIGGTFAVVDDHTVAYLDLTASGAETIAHLRDNGRITLMFCAFDGPPNVVRLHGVARFVTIYDEEYDEWADRFAPLAGARRSRGRRRRAGLRLLRVRRAAVRLGGRPRPAPAAHGTKGRRRPGRLSTQEEPHEHRRPACLRLRPCLSRGPCFSTGFAWPRELWRRRAAASAGSGAAGGFEE